MGCIFFSSSEFEHGEAVAESNGNFYAINHHDGKIYKADGLDGKITEDEATGFPANERPIRLSQSQKQYCLYSSRLF